MNTWQCKMAQSVLQFMAGRYLLTTIDDLKWAVHGLVCISQPRIASLVDFGKIPTQIST